MVKDEVPSEKKDQIKRKTKQNKKTETQHKTLEAKTDSNST